MIHKKHAPLWILLCLLIIIGGLAGCSADEPVAAPVEDSTDGSSEQDGSEGNEDQGDEGNNEEDTSEETEETTAALPYAFPLNGLPAEEDRKSIRPIAVVIENSITAYPQAGLIHSDLIYEVMVEGGITRFIAMYHSGLQEDTVLGPLRSVRHDFYELTQEYDAVMIHSGGSPKAYALIQSKQVKDIDEITMGGPFYRSKDRRAPHNLYASVRNLKAFSVKKGYKDDSELQPLPFYTTEEPAGEPADVVNIAYHAKYGVKYEYSRDAGEYKRFMRGKPHIDHTTGVHLSANNVVIQFAKHKSTDKEDRQEIDLVGEGKGFIAQNGVYTPIVWKKASAAARTILYTEDGKEVLFVPGKTFWHIVPTGVKVEWTNGL